jgi:hypothetical protein
MQEGTIFKRISLYYLVLAYLFSGGLYAVYWFITRGKLLYRSEPRFLRRILPNYILAIFCLYAILPLMALIADISATNMTILRPIFLVGLFALLLVYIAIGIIGADIARVVTENAGVSCSSRIAFLLAFAGLISLVYLQYCINQSHSYPPVR